MPHHQDMRYTGPAQNHPKRPLIELRQVSKIYQTLSGRFAALRDINLCVQRQECVAIVGKSGSGKSTLINLITGIDRPSTGEISVAGTSIHQLRENQLALWRGRTVGIVFQFFQLLPTLTVLENVMLPMDLCNTYGGSRQERALQLLERMGVVEQAPKLPAALSGGQQQRAAIARALANDPPLIVADEPTGNLDSKTADAVLALFTELVMQGKTVMLVTHERDIKRYINRQVRLVDGCIADEVEARVHQVSSGEVLP